MTEKRQFYETPWMDFLELQLASSCLIVSAENNFIDDPEPYFD